MSLRISTLMLLLVCVFTSGVKAAIVVPDSEDPPVVTASEEEIAAAVAEYRTSLKEMSGKERRELKREKRRAVKEALNDLQNDADTNTILLVILAILLPPVAVLVHQGELNSKFWIALLLTLLFYLPGLIYALLVIFGNA